MTDKERLDVIERRLSNIEHKLESLQPVQKPDKNIKPDNFSLVTQEQINSICSLWESGKSTRKIADSLRIREDIVYRVVKNIT